MPSRILFGVAAIACATAILAPAVLATPSPPESGKQAGLERAHAAAAKLRAQLKRERRFADREIARLHRALLTRPSVDHAIALGAAAYGVSPNRLRQVALCESHLNPRATNGHYHGLYQFGAPLWNATPFHGFARTDPYAAAFAAGWAFSRGMSRHWPICGR